MDLRCTSHMNAESTGRQLLFRCHISRWLIKEILFTAASPVLRGTDCCNSFWEEQKLVWTDGDTLDYIANKLQMFVPRVPPNHRWDLSTYSDVRETRHQTSVACLLHSRVWHARHLLKQAFLQDRLEENIADLEGKLVLTDGERVTLDYVANKLQMFDAEFHEHHYKLVHVDLIDGSVELAAQTSVTCLLHSRHACHLSKQAFVQDQLYFPPIKYPRSDRVSWTSLQVGRSHRWFGGTRGTNICSLFAT